MSDQSGNGLVGPDGLSTNGEWAVWLARTFGWYILPVWGMDNNLKCICGNHDCRTAGKHPLGRLVPNGENDATNDVDVLAAWWEQEPNANLAVATGKSNLVVADCDGDDGQIDFLNWSAGFGLEIPLTLEARTGGGGRHIFFGANGNELKSINRFLESVDLKARTGYVVLPPSMHKSGNRYSWVDVSSPIAPTPELLVERLHKMRARAATGQSRCVGTAAAYDYQDACKFGPKAGNRDEFFNARAFELRKLNFSRDNAVEELKQSWELCEQPKDDFYPWHDVLTKIIRIYENKEITPDELPDWNPTDSAESGESTTQSGLRLTDDGNALLFAHQHVDKVRFAVDAGEWYCWDGTHWTPRAETPVLDLARETVRSLARRASRIDGDSTRENELKHAVRSHNASRILAIRTLAQSDKRLSIRTTDFDKSPWLLNTPNGTFDLEQGVIREHRRDELLSKITNTEYVAGAEAPYWQWWINWAMGGRSDLVEFLQRAVGYAITGDTSEQVFFLLYGTGANGKTTFLQVIESILGDYAWHAEPELLTRREGAHPTGIADLHGKRFVVANETREGRKIDEQALKQLTGSDTITARRMYQNFFSFRPTAKIFFAVNNRPVITDDSYAMWRRMLLIPWDQRVAPDDQTKDLANRILLSEASGVLNWMIEGAMKWKREGGLLIPDVVKSHTESYKRNEDTIGEFISECLEIGEAYFASTRDIWNSYQSWCIDQSTPMRDRLARNILLQRLESRFASTRRRSLIEGKRVHGLDGMRVANHVTGQTGGP